MQFPERDLSCQYISQSYVDVLQQYVTGSTVYILDGLGNVVSSLTSGSNIDTASYLIGNAEISNYLYFNTASATASYSPEGYVWWDTEFKTLSIRPDITASSLQVGQEQWLRYTAAESISDGEALYISGTDSDGHPICSKAIADGTRTKYTVVALATHNASSGSHAFATVQGLVNDVNTAGIPAGSPIFLSETTAGGYRIGAPSEPYERILLGYCVNQDSTAGRIYVDIVGIPDAFRAFAGVTNMPSITNNGDGTITIGTGSVSLNTAADGSGTTRNWTLNSASFSVPLGITDVSYVIADYNGGSPKWSLVSGSGDIDSIQKTRVYTVTRAVTNNVTWANWDKPGLLLGNKLLQRIAEAHGVERTSGMLISESGSRYCQITSGSYWLGASKLTSSFYNSSTNSLTLLYHSASVWTSSVITQFNNSQYQGTNNLESLSPNSYNVNYVYKSAMETNRALIMLSPEYSKLVDAQASQPPAVPGDLLEGGILVGRAIYQNGDTTATQVDSAFVEQFTAGTTILHNDLSGLQGGTTDEYYHLTATEYAQLQAGTTPVTYRTVTATDTVLATDSILYGSASAANIILTMPLASAVDGQLFRIKKIDSTGYDIIISSSANIDYAKELRLSERGSSVTLHSNNSQYWIH